jgi:hypothetical protein
MSKGDADQPIRVAKMHAKVARSAIDSRNAERLALFEEEVARLYQYDDEAWRAETDALGAACRAVNDAIGATSPRPESRRNSGPRPVSAGRTAGLSRPPNAAAKFAPSPRRGSPPTATPPRSLSTAVRPP